MNGEKIIEEILDLKNKNQINDYQNQIIQKGFNYVLKGNIATHKEVKKRFEAKFRERFLNGESKSFSWEETFQYVLQS